MTVRLAAVAMTILVCACGDEERPPAAAAQPAEPDLVRVGEYGYAGGSLYDIGGAAPEALAVLPGAGVAPDTLEECAPAIPEFSEARFRKLRPSPDPSWASWETAGPGACVGVVGPGVPPVRALGHWSGAIPDSVFWAPAGRYLAVWLGHPGGRRSLQVFDAEGAARLAMPWDLDCTYPEDCDVVGAAWLGGTLLNVEISLGPAESPVPFEVNVTATAPADPTEEI
jgi:hypothetical protein